ncbi:MAG: DUF3226 domain-containing protein [Mariprofundales bacterium]
MKNFRLFSDLKITNINQVNLFVGKNNSGKTLPCEGDYKVLQKLNYLLKLDGETKKETIGIVLDADINLSNRWKSIKNKLVKYEYQLPQYPCEKSWQDEPGKPLGQSIDANILKSDKNSAMIFMAWLNKLFPANNNHN